MMVRGEIDHFESFTDFTYWYIDIEGEDPVK
jgi:hypothetical protein